MKGILDRDPVVRGIAEGLTSGEQCRRGNSLTIRYVAWSSYVQKLEERPSVAKAVSVLPPAFLPPRPAKCPPACDHVPGHTLATGAGASLVTPN